MRTSCHVALLTSMVMLACSGPSTRVHTTQPHAEHTVVFFTWYFYGPQICLSMAEQGASEQDIMSCFENNYDSEDVAEGELLVPLACVIADEGNAIQPFHGNSACESLVTTALPVHVLGPDMGAVTTASKRPFLCEGDGSMAMGYAAQLGTTKNTNVWGAQLAIWPKSAAKHVQWGAGKWTDSRVLPETERDALERAVLGESFGGEGGPRITIHQVVTLELDGNGQSDQLIALESPSDVGVFTGLFKVVNGERSLVFESDYEQFMVLAVMDLDGDGAQEILLENAYHEGTYYTLLRYDAATEAFVVLGSIGCGA